MIARHEHLPIRRAGSTDLPDLVELHRRVATQAYAHIFPPDHCPFPIEAVFEEWRGALDAEDVHVYVVNRLDTVLGTVTVRSPHVERLFVLPEWWGDGIGGRLHDCALRRLQRERVRSAQIIVLEDNLRARKFYEQRGWRFDGTRSRSQFHPFPFFLGYSIDLTEWSKDQA